jgi:hypothetical protein
VTATTVVNKGASIPVPRPSETGANGFVAGQLD